MVLYKQALDLLQQTQSQLEKSNKQLANELEENRVSFQEKEMVWQSQYKELKNLIER